MTPLNELTREQILAMEAGREMDAYVAEARGWSFRERTGIVDDLILLAYSPGGERYEYNFGNRRYDPISGEPVDLAVDWNDVDCLPAHSTDVGAAFELVPEMRKRWSRVEIHSVEDVYLCQVEANSGEWNERYVVTDETGTPSPSLAICRAFLLATLEVGE